MTSIDSPHSMHVSTGSAPSVVQIESGRLIPWLLLSTFASGLSIAIAMFADHRATQAERAAEKAGYEARIIQQNQMDQNALLLRAGLRVPTDALHGPAGNTQYLPPSEQKRR